MLEDSNLLEIIEEEVSKFNGMVRNLFLNFHNASGSLGTETEAEEVKAVENISIAIRKIGKHLICPSDELQEIKDIPNGLGFQRESCPFFQIEGDFSGICQLNPDECLTVPTGGCLYPLIYVSQLSYGLLWEITQRIVKCNGELVATRNEEGRLVTKENDGEVMMDPQGGICIISPSFRREYFKFTVTFLARLFDMALKEKGAMLYSRFLEHYGLGNE